MAKRSAELEHILVYYNEPQVVTLRSNSTRLIGVAVPTDEPDAQPFIAVTISTKDWQRYLDGNVDLRYPFIFPSQRIAYIFDLCKTTKSNKIIMEKWDDNIDIPEDYLPSPRFFSVNHTEEIEVTSYSEHTEILEIDGEWELVEFGQFQQKFSEVYAFLTLSSDFSEKAISTEQRKNTLRAFRNLPYQGGGSYKALYQELNENISHEDRLKLEKINYASPGTVEILGRSTTFEEVRQIITQFISMRREVLYSHKDIYQYLHKNKYLTASTHTFDKGSAVGKYIKEKTDILLENMEFKRKDTIFELCDNNELKYAKVALSLFRRIDKAASYFAQARINFST